MFKNLFNQPIKIKHVLLFMCALVFAGAAGGAKQLQTLLIDSYIDTKAISAPAVSATAQARIYQDSTTKDLKYSPTGGTYRHVTTKIIAYKNTKTDRTTIGGLPADPDFSVTLEGGRRYRMDCLLFWYMGIPTGAGTGNGVTVKHDGTAVMEDTVAFGAGTAFNSEFAIHADGFGSSWDKANGDDAWYWTQTAGFGHGFSFTPTSALTDGYFTMRITATFRVKTTGTFQLSWGTFANNGGPATSLLNDSAWVIEDLGAY